VADGARDVDRVRTWDVLSRSACRGFAPDSGGIGRGEDFEVELLVELGEIALSGHREQFGGHGGEHAVVASGVIAQGLSQLWRHEARVAGSPEQVGEAGGEFVAVQISERCDGCGYCVKSFECPALVHHAEDKKHKHTTIDPLLCAGCGVCLHVCPKGSFQTKQPAPKEKKKKAQPTREEQP